MKINKTLTALIAGASLGMSGQTFAAGTTSGTEITNRVSLDYSVDGQDQTDIPSADLTFKVDTKVDFTLVLQDSPDISVTPDKSYIVEYLLTNTGNSAIDFNLAASNIADGSTGILIGDPASVITRSIGDDLTGVSAFVESEGEYDPSGTAPTSSFASGDDTDVHVVSLSEDFAQVIYVSVTAAGIDEDILAAALTATAATGTTGSTAGTALDDDHAVAFDAANEQIVFADSSNNGFETINSSFKVVTAKFTHNPGTGDVDGLGLSVNVINDTLCDENLDKDTTKIDYSFDNGVNTCSVASSTYYPKAIPGSMVEYTITATNSGNAAATEVIITQNLIDVVGGAGHVDLQTNSLKNVIVSFFDSSTGSTNTSITNTAVDPDNDLKIDLSSTGSNITFDTSDSITITFTAIAE